MIEPTPNRPLTYQAEDYWRMAPVSERDPATIYHDYIAMQGEYAVERGPDGTPPSMEATVKRIVEFRQLKPDVYVDYRMDDIADRVVRQHRVPNKTPGLTEWTGARAGEGLSLMQEPGRQTLSIDYPSMALKSAVEDLAQGKPDSKIVIAFNKADQASGKGPEATCAFVSRSNPADKHEQPIPLGRLAELLGSDMFNTPLSRGQRVARMALSTVRPYPDPVRRSMLSLHPADRRLRRHLPDRIIDTALKAYGFVGKQKRQ